jgi:hypothetical protein
MGRIVSTKTKKRCQRLAKLSIWRRANSTTPHISTKASNDEFIISVVQKKRAKSPEKRLVLAIGRYFTLVSLSKNIFFEAAFFGS